MKIAVISDCHLNRKNFRGVMDRDLPDLPFRNVDFMKSFDFMVDKCVNEIHPDLVVITGDIYDHFDPSNEVRGYVSSRLKQLGDAKIPTIILIGNHDVCKKDHALKGIQELGLKAVKIVDQPMDIWFKNKRLMLFPYSIDIERDIISTKDLFYKFIEDCHEKQFDEDETLFFGHMGISGATISEYFATKLSKHVNMENLKKGVLREFANGSKGDVSLKDLSLLPAKYIFLGDYHRFQVLPVKGKYAMYAGSIEKSDFSEINQKKGFVVYDDELEEDVEMGMATFIEYEGCRPMLELRGNLEDMRKTLTDLDSNSYQNAVVKLAFIGDSAELFHFSNRLDFLKKEIRDLIDPIHMFHTQNVIDEEQEEQALELEEEIIEKGHMGVEEVLSSVKEILKEKISDEHKRNRAIVRAEGIYDKVRSGQKS